MFEYGFERFLSVIDFGLATLELLLGTNPNLLRLFAALHFAPVPMRAPHRLPHSGHYTGSGFVHDFPLHEIQAVLGTASVRDRQHHRHHVRGR